MKSILIFPHFNIQKLETKAIKHSFEYEMWTRSAKKDEERQVLKKLRHLLYAFIGAKI